MTFFSITALVIATAFVMVMTKAAAEAMPSLICFSLVQMEFMDALAAISSFAKLVSSKTDASFVVYLVSGKKKT